VLPLPLSYRRLIERPQYGVSDKVGEWGE
jgi:hypothetical protein